MGHFDSYVSFRADNDIFNIIVADTYIFLKLPTLHSLSHLKYFTLLNDH